jgi:uncharacterized membrane protein YqiK
VGEDNEYAVMKVLIVFAAIVLIVFIIGGFILWYKTAYEHEVTMRQALNAGLVQQPIVYGGSVWVKPEDYKPYRIDDPIAEPQ